MMEERTEIEDAWTTMLVRGVTTEMLDSVWRKTIGVGYPKSIVLTCWYIEDREKSAQVAYC
jgi:hypothetical protein